MYAVRVSDNYSKGGAVEQDLIGLYLTMLRDPTVPAHRVVRKTAVLTLAGLVFLIFYRHVALGLDLGKPALATAILGLLLIAVVGIFGGVMAGAFYESFLQSVGAQKKQLTLPVFFAEWLFIRLVTAVGVCCARSRWSGSLVTKPFQGHVVPEADACVEELLPRRCVPLD